MVDKIEMSLDDIIKSSKPQRGAGGRGGVNKNGAGPRTGGGRGGPPRNGSGGGGFRQNLNRSGGGGGGGVLKGRQRGGIQRSKYARGDVNSAWKHDMYEGARKSRLLAAAGLGGGLGGGGPGGLGSTKLMVSNLDFGVSESDINELFADFGPLKSASVHYDRSGRSLGTADVVFERRADAIKAMKQYNGVPLDGRPMSIQLATSEIPVPRAPRLCGSSDRSSGLAPRSPRSPRSPGRRQGGGRGDGGSSRGNSSQSNQRRGGGGGGPRRQQRETKTAEELDAELDAYTKDMK